MSREEFLGKENSICLDTLALAYSKPVSSQCG